MKDFRTLEVTQYIDCSRSLGVDGGFGKVLQGYVESSNVNDVQQLVDMIETQRAYEVSSKSITAVDEMMQFISRNL